MRMLLARLLRRTGLCRFLTFRRDQNDLRFHNSSMLACFWADQNYREEDRAFLRREVQPGDLVVDVGANVGVLALLAARLGARVLAFEPNARISRILQDQARRNELENLRVYCMAIGQECGRTRVTDLRQDDRNVCGDEGEPVEQHHLDCIVGWQRDVALLKVDVEGRELDVLKGAVRMLGRTRCVMVEQNDGRAGRWLEGKGWRLDGTCDANQIFRRDG